MDTETEKKSRKAQESLKHQLYPLEKGQRYAYAYAIGGSWDFLGTCFVETTNIETSQGHIFGVIVAEEEVAGSLTSASTGILLVFWSSVPQLPDLRHSVPVL